MSLGQHLAPHLPFLRRFGRMLTGTQSRGDAFIRATLQAIVDDPESFPRNVDPRIGLYQKFLSTIDGTVPANLAASSVLKPTSEIADALIYNDARRALLLTAMEGFHLDDTAYLLKRPVDEINELISQGMSDMRRSDKAKILIVENEPMIAMELESTVEEMGYETIGIAIKEDDAIFQAQRGGPDLVLVDIELEDNGSGIEAAKRILADQKPALIFITAFPERLLIEDRPDPTFLITKPYQRSTIKSAITQALFLMGWKKV